MVKQQAMHGAMATTIQTCVRGFLARTSVATIKAETAAALKAERDALATRCAFLESESADAQKAVQSAQAEKTSAAAAQQLELEKANQARRKAEAKQQAEWAAARMVAADNGKAKETA